MNNAKWEINRNGKETFSVLFYQSEKDERGDILRMITKRGLLGVCVNYLIDCMNGCYMIIQLELNYFAQSKLSICNLDKACTFI